LNGVAYKFMNAEIVVKNALQVINENYGTDRAEGFYREGFRDITFAIEARLTDDLAAYTIAEGGNRFELFIQTGQTEGNIVAKYAPQAEFDTVPEISDEIGALTLNFAGSLFENLAAGNDEFSLGLL
jgi:hypothetical protein